MCSMNYITFKKKSIYSDCLFIYFCFISFDYCWQIQISSGSMAALFKVHKQSSTETRVWLDFVSDCMAMAGCFYAIACDTVVNNCACMHAVVLASNFSTTAFAMQQISSCIPFYGVYLKMVSGCTFALSFEFDSDFEPNRLLWTCRS